MNLGFVFYDYGMQLEMMAVYVANHLFSLGSSSLAKALEHLI